MTLGSISLAYLRARPLGAALNVLLLALGVATVTLLLLASRQIESRMHGDARGIDLVVGAKGSPMQLVLAAVFHIDAPGGNIPLDEANKLAAHRAVKQAIPMALGDSYKGHRIVGTTHAYPGHYGAKLAAGRLWAKPMEAVLGADAARATGLAPGATFAGAHGMGGGDGEGEAHEQSPFAVVGLLAPTGTVLDRLVLTSVESVWEVHGTHGEKDADQEITALLLRYATPLAAATLPRQVNANPYLQAGSPAYESARLFRMIGVGVDVLRAFGVVLMLTAGLSVFIALTNALEERRYDLAVMRMLGGGRGKLFGLLLVEGLLLAALGAALGLALGHAAAGLVGSLLEARQQAGLTGWLWLNEEWWIAGGALAVGFAAGLVPGLRAYRADVAGALAEG
jgi:putative ABC transport system permease protein